MDPEALADAQGAGLLDAVPGAKLADRGVILDCEGSERVS